MYQRDGLWWPDADRVAYEIIRSELPFLDVAIEACLGRRLALQAGGNAGIYPLHLSKSFDAVITVEPDKQNYDCLVKNTEEISTIFPVYGALGDDNRKVGVKRYPENCGASFIEPSGDIPMFTIDEMGIDPDFIQLDIEGFEGMALLGAVETLNRCNPVVMVEQCGHEARYGRKASEILEEMGYKRIDSNRTDTIWQRPIPI